MQKIDKRIHYIIVMDTETANDIETPMVYDIGWQIIDKRGKVYEKKSYIVKEIFYDESELMQSAYYAQKIPLYKQDIANGARRVAKWFDIRQDLWETMRRYNTKTICAHNARFDYKSTNITQRWLTKSRYRYFLPYNCEIWDTMKMAMDVVAKTPTYKAFCAQYGYMTGHKTPRPKVTAEVLYRYISCNKDFNEAHTALEDVEIESQILAYCFRKHKAMRKIFGKIQKRY